jgi:hypothetical protein
MTTGTEHCGDVEMLSESISLAREALDCVNDSMKFQTLETLGIALIVKASHTGDLDDLEEGICRTRQMLEYIEERTTFYVYGTMTVSNALLQQYEMNPSQHLHALSEAIQLLEALGRQRIPEIYRADVLHWTAKAYRV